MRWPPLTRDQLRGVQTQRRRGSKSRAIGRGPQPRRPAPPNLLDFRLAKILAGGAQKGADIAVGPRSPDFDPLARREGRAGRSGIGGSRCEAARAPVRRSVTGAGRLRPRGERRGSGLGGQRETRGRARLSCLGRGLSSGLPLTRSGDAVGSVTARHVVSAANSRGDMTIGMPLSRGVLVFRSLARSSSEDRLRDLHSPIESASVSLRHQPSRPAQASDVPPISRRPVILLQNRCCHSCRVAPTEKSPSDAVDSVDIVHKAERRSPSPRP